MEEVAACGAARCFPDQHRIGRKEGGENYDVTEQVDPEAIPDDNALRGWPALAPPGDVAERRGAPMANPVRVAGRDAVIEARGQPALPLYDPDVPAQSVAQPARSHRDCQVDQRSAYIESHGFDKFE